jgi:hypothetical protein
MKNPDTDRIAAPRCGLGREGVTHEPTGGLRLPAIVYGMFLAHCGAGFTASTGNCKLQIG